MKTINYSALSNTVILFLFLFRRRRIGHAARHFSSAPHSSLFCGGKRTARRK